MRLSIITACRTISRIDVAGKLVCVNIETECEMLNIHTAALIYKEPRYWWAMVPNDIFEAIYEARTVEEAYHKAWSAIRRDHREHCTGFGQPDISKRRPEIQEISRYFAARRRQADDNVQGESYDRTNGK